MLRIYNLNTSCQPLSCGSPFDTLISIGSTVLYENMKVVFPIEQKVFGRMRNVRNKSCAMKDTRAQECMKHTFVLIFSGKENTDETTYDSQ